jgi:hypothetical protein
MTADHPTTGMRRRIRVGTAALTALIIATSAGCAGSAPAGQPAPPASTDRQAQVAERGAAVMPFDLERTTHRFAKTGTGGVQTVVADNPDDTTQIRLVRRHLRDEADRFRRGDFTDPARIHGDGMPGLAALRDSAGAITVDYTTTADGARITYTTGDSTLVTALHAWFDAQVSDHGDHATHD